MNILIGGDVSPIGINKELFKEGKIDKIYSDILDELEKSDLNILNLECPLIKTEKPIEKTGPVMGVPEDCIKGISDAGFDIAGLANNHILDHDQEGVLNTIKVLNKYGIKTVGAGKDLSEASKVLEVEKDGLKIGIIAMAEKEFSIATDEQAGANPLDVIQFTRQMEVHRANFDFVIVLLHGGYQHYPFPSPDLQKVSRFLVEQGANAVICQHSHCAGCIEEYKEAVIVYGQGNFIFNKFDKDDEWYKGFLVKLNIGANNKLTYELIPFQQNKKAGGVAKMKGQEADTFLNIINFRSEQIKSQEFVQNNWNQFSNELRNEYFSYLRGHSKLMRKVNKKIGFTEYTYRNSNILALCNIIRCESHREALIATLNNNQESK